jgi:hypothetical protein
VKWIANMERYTAKNVLECQRLRVQVKRGRVALAHVQRAMLGIIQQFHLTFCGGKQNKTTKQNNDLMKNIHS